MIPKIIHYCWLSDEPYPEDLKQCMSTWKEKLPDYEFVLWNFERFDKASSPWVSQAFDNKKYAFAADYIRLYAVYNYGGIYMDMDIEVLKPFDELLDSNLMLAYEDEERTGIEAGCFGAEKGNHVIGECLNYYAGRSFIKSDGSFDTLPLPRIMMQPVSRYPELKIRDRYSFTCKSYKTGIITIKADSYTVHHFAGSWVSEYEKQLQNQIQKIYAKYGENGLARFLVVLTGIKKRLGYFGIKATVQHYIDKYIRRKNVGKI